MACPRPCRWRSVGLEATGTSGLVVQNTFSALYSSLSSTALGLFLYSAGENPQKHQYTLEHQSQNYVLILRSVNILRLSSQLFLQGFKVLFVPPLFVSLNI